MRKNTYLRFGGIDITDYGAVFSGSDEFRKPEKMMDYYSVPGRNGDIAVSQEKYSNIVLPFSCYIHEDFQENFHKLVNDLAALEGYQKLESSEEPDHYRLALFSTAIEPDMGALNERGAFILEFNCKPQRFLKVGDVAINVISNRTVDEGTVVSADDTDNTTQIESAEVELDPYLNTNGYGDVWLPGYGKNKLKTTATEETVNGLSFNPNDDGTIEVSGTSSEALTVTTDSEIYSKRVVENGYRLFDEIVGGSIVWNQLVQNGNFADGQTNWYKSSADISVTDGELSVTVSGTWNNDARQSLNTYANHKYMAHFEAKADSTLAGNSAAYIGQFNGGNARVVSPTLTTSYVTTIGVLASTVDSSGIRLTISSAGTSLIGSKCYFKNVYLIDLTQMFGTTIADYIYNLEQSNSGQGVALFKKLFNLDYYSYNSGTIMSVSTSSHEMVGFNQWDEEWEVGGISNITGENTTTSGRVRSTNYIPCFENTIYYFYASQNVSFRTFYYDSNKTFISASPVVITNQGFTTPSGTAYVRFIIVVGSLDDIHVCINKSDASKNGTYEPYQKNTYSLSPLTLRGIPKLVDNKLVYDGDIYKSSGEVTRRYAEVDLGTLTWTTRTTGTNNKLFSATLSQKYPNAREAEMNWISDKQYRGKTTAVAVNSNGVDTYETGVYSYQTATASTQKENTIYCITKATETPSGKVIYEIAEPATESTTPYTKPQECEQGGTEEYVDYEVSQGNRDVSIPVGHNTFYADYVVSDEGKITESETYNVSSDLTVGYRDSSGMHTTTNSLTIPSGGEYEFAAYTIAASQTPTKIEPMIYDGIPTTFEPYENAGYLVTYDKAVMTETPRNVYLMEDETKYTHGVYVKCKDGVVTLDGNNTDATYKEVPVGELFETAGGYIASGGIPQGNCYLFVKKYYTPIGGTIQTEDIMVYDQDVAVTLSANENASVQFYIHIAPSEGNGLEFKPMLRHTPITDDEFTEGVTGSREFSQTFNSPIAAGAYDFYSNNLTETWALLDLSTLTWTEYATSSTRRCYRTTLSQYPRGAFSNTPDFLAELYTIQKRTNDARIMSDLDSHEVGIWGQYTTAAASTLLYIIMPLDAGTPEGYFAYKRYEPVVTNYGPTDNVDVIPDVTTYFFSYSRELFRGPHYNTIKLTYNSPTVIENPTNMASLPLISIVNNGSQSEYVYVNNANIHIEITGDGVTYYDAEMRDAYEVRGDIYASMNQYVSANNVIKLKPGKNAVALSSDSMIVKVIPRWWEL